MDLAKQCLLAAVAGLSGASPSTPHEKAICAQARLALGVFYDDDGEPDDESEAEALFAASLRDIESLTFAQWERSPLLFVETAARVLGKRDDDAMRTDETLAFRRIRFQAALALAKDPGSAEKEEDVTRLASATTAFAESLLARRPRTCRACPMRRRGGPKRRGRLPARPRQLPRHPVREPA